MFSKIIVGISLFYLASFFISLIPFENKDVVGRNLQEKFVDSLSKINSMDKLMLYVDHEIPDAKNIKDTEIFVRKVSTIMKNRFVHGIAQYSFQDNFLLYYFSLLTLNEQHRGIVDPEDIIKYSLTMCSQQSIVFQEIMKRKKIKYASVRLVGHFCSGVFYSGNWYLVDTDREIDYSGLKQKPTLQEISKDSILADRLYEKILQRVPEKERYNHNIFRKISIDHINSFPAPNVIILQKVTAFLSRYGIFFVAVILWMTLRKYKKNN